MVKQPPTYPIEWSPEQDWRGMEAGEAGSPAEIYQRQRARCPVAWRAFDDGQGFWSVFNYDDVVGVLSDPDTFSSAVPKYGISLIPIEVDPPDHRKYRILLAQLINPARLQPIEARIREFVTGRLERVLAGEDTLLSVTAALPIEAFCLLVGDPDPERFRAIHEAREANNDPRLARLDPESASKRQAANQPLVDYCARLIAAHRASPRDDIVSDILAGAIDDRPISDDEALRMLSLLYIAGNRTTTAALRGSVVQLARAPDIQATLRREPSKIPAAIEEILRLETPIHGLPRYAMRDTVIGGCEIKKGEQVFPNYGAANLDPSVFRDAEIIDLERKPLRHVAFGRGIHLCAGAPLARLQIRVFLEELLAGSAEFKLIGPITRMKWPHFGATSLPVRLERA